MKPAGSALSYSDQRAKELYAAYKRALPLCKRANGTYDGNAAIAAAIASPSSRYWISEGVAYNYIQRMREDVSFLVGVYPQKRLLYQSLFATFKKLREDPSNDELNDMQVAYLASASPAPSFFMSMSSAKIIISKERCRRKAMRQ